MSKWANSHLIKEDHNPLWVVKRNELIRAKFDQKLGVEAFQIFSFLLAHINPYKPLPDNQISFTRAELCKALKGVIDDSSFYKNTKKILVELRKTGLTLEKLSKSREPTGEFISINIFEVAALASDRVYFKFTNSIAPYISSIDALFTKTEDKQIQKIRSFYGWRVYELCKLYIRPGKEYFSFNIDLDELKEYLAIAGKYNGRFDNFKKFVLESSKQEINKTDTLKIDYEPIKVGRKIASINFHVWVKKSLKQITEDNKLLELIEKIKDALNWREQLELMLTPHDFKQVIELYDRSEVLPSQIEANISYILDRIEDPGCPRIANLSKYTKKAIVENYVNHKKNTVDELLDVSWANKIKFELN
ncbi:replication initiation protein [Zooshikella ganghwensis]|uniref:Replication initiation protein n=1 Tax=Zooshikella ganghwensis TaxID=202772 RepID=A0A4P9VJ92_9GAMM|nr:replication initiation protein [Zooshikella ganghwensis]RDH41812.1 replication initiation protein [Zooshikella ganghwensis]RDH41844.1 replication initiation protein [Zooshikella ganghwensis]